MVYFFFTCFFIFWVESAYPLLHLQVPADGVLISGHSLAIDESSMTGESKTVSLLEEPVAFFFFKSASVGIFMMQCYFRFTRIKRHHF